MRVKRGLVSKRKHNKIFRSNKGYRMTKRRLIKVAKEAYLHAGEYAFMGRRKRKRDFRSLWISRIAEAVKLEGLRYGEFIKKLKDNQILLDRKILSYFVTDKPELFKAVVEKVKTK